MDVNKLRKKVDEIREKHILDIKEQRLLDLLEDIIWVLDDCASEGELQHHEQTGHSYNDR